MMAGLCELVSRDPHTDERTKLDTTFRHLRELTRTMEAEIPEAVLSCARARAVWFGWQVPTRPRHLSSTPTTGPNRVTAILPSRVCVWRARFCANRR